MGALINYGVSSVNAAKRPRGHWGMGSAKVGICSKGRMHGAIEWVAIVAHS